MIALGVALFYLGVARDRGAVFPGAFLFLLGLLNLLRNEGVLDLPWSLTWPLIVMALGIAFVTLFLFDPSRKGAVLPGTILIVIAFVFLSFPGAWLDILAFVSSWWPLIFVLIGLRILWGSMRKFKRTRTPEL
jgi:membrane-bound ClpP family serine protease